MKNYFIGFLLTLIFIAGCKDEIYVIPNYDSEYTNLQKHELPKQKLNGNEISFDEFVEHKLKQMETDLIEKKYDYRLYIDEEGKIKNVKINNSTGKDFDDKLISNMKNWEFEPAIKNGNKIKFSYDLNSKINFSRSGNNINESEFLINADEMPQPVGGIEAILKNIVYPEDARKSGIEGRVLVKTFLDEQGNVISTGILKGENESLNNAALSAIEKVKFTPGKVNGTPVKMQIVIPVAFKLDS